MISTEQRGGDDSMAAALRALTALCNMATASIEQERAQREVQEGIEAVERESQCLYEAAEAEARQAIAAQAKEEAPVLEEEAGGEPTVEVFEMDQELIGRRVEVVTTDMEYEELKALIYDKRGLRRDDDEYTIAPSVILRIEGFSGIVVGTTFRHDDNMRGGEGKWYHITNVSASPIYELGKVEEIIVQDYDPQEDDWDDDEDETRSPVQLTRVLSEYGEVEFGVSYTDEYYPTSFCRYTDADGESACLDDEYMEYNRW